MARDESSREDLLGEATALVERVEFVPLAADLSSEWQHLVGQRIVAGFRRDGALSIFFDEDPVYQFNASGELRRAYCDGKLLKGVQGRLVALDRVRTPNEVQLVRHELSQEDEARFMRRMHETLRHLEEVIDAGSFRVIGTVPPEADVLSRVQKELSAQSVRRIAAKPNV